MNRTLAEVQESIKLEELRAAEKEVGQLMNFDLFLSDLIDFRQSRHEDILSNDTTEEDVSVTIGSISFDLTLFSKPPTTIPLEIRYSTPICSDAIMNFNFYISSIDSSIIDAGNLLARTAVGEGLSTEDLWIFKLQRVLQESLGHEHGCWSTGQFLGHCACKVRPHSLWCRRAEVLIECSCRLHWVLVPPSGMVQLDCGRPRGPDPGPSPGEGLSTPDQLQQPG